MKKFLSLIIVLILLINSAPLGYASNDIKVTLNGQYLGLDQPPVIINNSTFVPIRTVCEKLGADVYWIQSEQYIVIVKNEIKLFLQIGTKQMDKLIVKDFLELALSEDLTPETIPLDAPPQIINNKTLLPIRAVCEALGAKVVWNKSSNTVEINCPQDVLLNKNKDTTFFSKFVSALAANSAEAAAVHKKDLKERYANLPYTVLITISDIPKDEYVSIREFIEARIDSTSISNFHTIDMSEDTAIYIAFGHDGSYPVNKLVSSFTTEPKLYFKDAAGNIILDKTDFDDIESQYSNNYYDIVALLNTSGRKKLSDAIKKITKTTHDNILLSMFFDDILISQKCSIDENNLNKIIVSDKFNYSLASSIAYLAKTKYTPKNLKIQVEIDKNN